VAIIVFPSIEPLSPGLVSKPDATLLSLRWFDSCVYSRHSRNWRRRRRRR